ncbi:hypothetical protein PVAND_000733 [Polypedilum vanderplanki]|uniref:Uncharacterized protein n=1 Tax=Polypedilum vanderplanki TaxID=319348 RepID=A0A9J6BM60_POLVA|nr:hypothetical protein PVAND_000733 [Polypedilum vanderplanki]
MRRTERGDFKNNNFSRSNNQRDNRNDRYHDDKYRNSANKSFDSHRNSDFKKPRRDYDGGHSYQDRHRDNSRDHRDCFEGERFQQRNDRKDERSFRNHSPPSRSRDGGGHSRATFRSNNDIRRRMDSPPAASSRMRGDYKQTTGIKSRLAPMISSRITAMNSRRISSTGTSRIVRRNDLRSGIIAKRSTAPVNRAKEYAKKIRQARLKLNESNSVSSSKAKSEAKSPKASDENAEEDFLAIANDVNFDDDDRESSTGAKRSKSKLNEQKEECSTSNANVEVDDEEKKKKISDEPSSSKDIKEERQKSMSRSRSGSNEPIRKFDRIEYICIHCGKRSTHAHEYRSHLSGRKHQLAMRNVGLRVRATLNRLRKVQRDKQLEIEAMIKDVEDIPSRYCQTCKLNFRQSKEEHKESEDHKKIRNFLKPYCKICRLQLMSPMKYEVHRCHTDHIRRKLKAQEASDDEVDLENMDIGDFKTVDSVGNVDDDNNDEDKTAAVGIELVSKIEANYCSLCHDFICRDGEKGEDEIIADHCKSRRHINRYNDYKKEEERKEAKAKKDGPKSPAEKSVKQNGNDLKHEKADKVDRDADVNLDENTYEGSEKEDH